MKREVQRRLIVVSILVLVVAAAGVSFFIFGAPRFDFVTTLANIEEIQQQNQNLAPASLYRQAGRLAKTRSQWLSLLKRLYRFQSKPDFNVYLLQLSSQALKSLRHDQILRAFYLSALLDNGKFAQAASRLTALSPSYDSLKAEILLSQLALARNINLETASLHTILANGSADDYYQVAQWLQDPRLLYNSALFYLQENQGQRAWQISSQLNTHDWLPQYVLGLIAYDQQQFTQAIIHFLVEIDRGDQQTPKTIYQLIGDSYLQLQNYESALRYYQQARTNADIWQSYYNQSFAYFQLGDHISSSAAIQSGLQRFPHEERLLIRLTGSLATENRLLVVNLINDFREQFERSANVELLAMALNSEQLAHPVYLSRLWQLFNNYPDHRGVSEFLIWYLLGLNYQHQAQVAIERVLNYHQQEPTWLSPYRGMLYLLDQKPAAAYAILKRVVSEKPSWDRNYNLALAQVKLEQYQQAYQSLLQGLELEPQRLGMYIFLLQRIATHLGLDDQWRDRLPDGAPPAEDGLLGMMEGLYVNDNPQEPRADSDAAAVGEDSRSDF